VSAPATALFSREQQVGGGIRNLRSDARMVARMLSLGVIEEEQAKGLLRQLFGLIAREHGAANPSARNIAALWKIPLTAVALERQEVELGMKARGEITEAPTVQVNVEVVSQIRSQLLSDPKVLEAIRIVEAGEAGEESE